MTATVKAFGDWYTNAGMIADVAKLGYLDGRVMDPTWGVGNFWAIFKPKRLVRHDLYTLDGVDCTDRRNIPHRDRSFDSIVLDLPYAFRGRASKDFDAKYGVNEYMSAYDIMQRIFRSVRACEPLLKHEGYLLVKCQDQVVSGRVIWQTDEITKVGEGLGLRKVDRFDLSGGREQPEGRTKKCPQCTGVGTHAHFNSTLLMRAARTDFPCHECGGAGRIPSKQKHAGYRPSTLLVFQKPKARKRKS